MPANPLLKTTDTPVAIKAPLVFIRHGETSWNEAGRYQGDTDTSLSNKGIKTADINGSIIQKLFKTHQLDKTQVQLIASPLQRAQQTAQRIAASFAYPEAVRPCPDLRELSLGRWEGLTSPEVKQKFYEERKSRKQDRWHFKPSGGESMAERAPQVLAALQNLPPHGVIVTHSMVMRIILHLLGNKDKQEAAESIILHQGLMLWNGQSIEIITP